MNTNSRLFRRDFLQIGAATTLATTLAAIDTANCGAEQPAANTDGPWLRKTLKIGMIRVKGSLTEKFKTAKEAGF